MSPDAPAPITPGDYDLDTFRLPSGFGWAVGSSEAGPVYVVHSSYDCPALRNTERFSVTGAWLTNVATGEIWACSMLRKHGKGAFRIDSLAGHRLPPRRWCLRCGSAPEPAPQVCPRCYLTACDCDG